MVKDKRFIFIAFLMAFLFSKSALASSFEASVDRQRISIGQSFTLELILKDANPLETPDLSVLESSFRVISQSHSSKTTIINNKFSSSVSWIITLMPKDLGANEIPAITLNTEQGELQTDTIKLRVLPVSKSETDDYQKDIFVKTEISKQSPYLEEPIILTARLYSRNNITGVEYPDLVVEDSVTEKHGKHKVYSEALGGIRFNVIEISYLITPLSSGPINIPPIIFEGQTEAPVSKHNRYRDPFDIFGGLTRLSSYEPFAIAGNELTIDVKAPDPSVNPWLPLSKLDLEETWDIGKSLVPGEPITRKIMMKAYGANATSLPDFESFMQESDLYKIYSDKPRIENKANSEGSAIVGYKEQIFTIIPKRSGSLTLPEIEIKWWDIDNGSIELATLPEKKLIIQEGNNQNNLIVKQSESKVDTNNLAQNNPAYSELDMDGTADQLEANSSNQQVYERIIFIISAIAVLLLLTVIFLLKKIAALERKIDETNAKSVSRAYASRTSAKKTEFAKLRRAATIVDIKRFLEDYAYNSWNMNKNASLDAIKYKVKNNKELRYSNQVDDFFDDLNAALYANKSVDLESLKEQCLDMLKKSAKSNKRDDRSKSNKVTLNPT